MNNIIAFNISTPNNVAKADFKRNKFKKIFL
jgi:hypothetical protein